MAKWELRVITNWSGSAKAVPILKATFELPREFGLTVTEVEPKDSKILPISKNIQRWRSEKGWSQMQLAQITGLPLQLIQLVESGQVTPSINHLITFAEALSVSLDRLVLDTG